MLNYIIALALLCGLDGVQGGTMRTVPFREVLHGVAYKMGLDPDQSNFLTNQAIPIGTYIDEWVRRTYDISDWPEWVVTHKFTPNASHIVPWDAPSSDFVSAREPLGTVLKLGRVLKVYLVDPATTNAPVDTPFTLKDEGIHVGYEHGTYVWIKFMAPPPRYTAVQWRSDNIFAKDDVTYSYTTGQVYKSKANGNIGHDPASTFSVPPIPHLIEPQPPSPAPDTEVTQEWVAGNPGVIAQNQIVDAIYLIDAGPPDPPPANTRFYIEVRLDDGITVGDASNTTTGTETINDMLDDLAAQLTANVATFPTFTFSVNHTTKTLRVEDASNFTVTRAFWGLFTQPNINVPIVQIQPLLTTVAATPLTPQISTLTLTPEQVVPGAVYSLTFTDGNGVQHTVTYTAGDYDGAEQILSGLLAAITAAQATDDFFLTVSSTFDATSLTASFSVPLPFSVDAVAPPPGSSWWELVPFPRAIADQVMTGALGDLLDEWGQWDKGSMVQQAVPAESEIAATDFAPTPNPPLTSQQKPMSRYQLQ